MTMQILEFLRGKKTYVMIAIGALDQLGAYQGWWEGERLREIAEMALFGGFLRAGVEKSGPVPAVK